MKSISIVGNLGANAVRRMTSDGRELMSFNVAVSSGKDGALWFNCVGTFREKVFGFLIKGQCVAVTGDFSADIFNGRIDLSVSIDRLELCGRAPQAAADPVNTTPQPTADPSQVAANPQPIARDDYSKPL